MIGFNERSFDQSPHVGGCSVKLSPILHCLSILPYSLDSCFHSPIDVEAN